MTAAVLERTEAAVASAPPAPATLDDWLAFKGIEPYDTQKVVQFKQAFARAHARGPFADWQSIPLGEYLARLGAGKSDTGGDMYAPIPESVQETIGRAIEIPDSAIVIERYDRDPFVRIDSCVGGNGVVSRYIAHFESDFEP